MIRGLPKGTNRPIAGKLSEEPRPQACGLGAFYGQRVVPPGSRR